MLKLMIIMLVTLFAISFGVILGPLIKESAHVNHMSNEQIIEFVLEMTEEEYIDYLNSLTKKQAMRVMNIKNAYDINRLSSQDTFTY